MLKHYANKLSCVFISGHAEIFMKLNFSISRLALAASIIAATPFLLTSCAVFTVADAAVTVAATAVKVTAKTVGAAADLVLPSSDKKPDKEKDSAKK
jgi:hypothetical protein